MKHLLLAALLAFSIATPALADDDIVIEGDEAKPAATASAPAARDASKPTVAAITEGQEAVSMFGRACVATKGEIGAITTKLAELEKNKQAKKLTADEAKKATGRETGNAWALESPFSDQKLLLSKDNDGSCNLFINRGDVKNIRTEFQTLAQWTAAQEKTVVAKQTKNTTEGGVALVTEYFEVLTQDKTKRPMLILSSTEKPKSDTQFVLTYKTIQSKVDAPKIEVNKKK